MVRHHRSEATSSHSGDRKRVREKGSPSKEKLASDGVDSHGISKRQASSQGINSIGPGMFSFSLSFNFSFVLLHRPWALSVISSLG
jgi:hypothetical protein